MKETDQSPPDGIPFFIDDDIIIRIRIPWPCVDIPDNVQLGQSRFLLLLRPPRKILESVSHLNNIKPSLFELNLHQWQNNLRNSFISIICGTSSSPACNPIPHYQFQFDYYLSEDDILHCFVAATFGNWLVGGGGWIWWSGRCTSTYINKYIITLFLPLPGRHESCRDQR